MYIKIENGIIVDAKVKPVAGYTKSSFSSRAISNEHGTFLYKADGTKRSKSDIDSDPMQIEGVAKEKITALRDKQIIIFDAFVEMFEILRDAEILDASKFSPEVKTKMAELIALRNE